VTLEGEMHGEEEKVVSLDVADWYSSDSVP
jgi:hypothetical protein